MPSAAVPHRTVRLCIALLVAAISLSGQSAAPVAAAEAAVGLAILLSLYRNRETVDMERFNLLRW